jgi:glycosyltransferase involved in cell wall biosynthesis
LLGLGPKRRTSDPDIGRTITFLIWNAYATGGTVRTVVRQANALAERGWCVTLVSVIAHGKQVEPFFELHPAVELETLVHRNRLRQGRSLRARLLVRIDALPRPTRQLSIGRASQASLLTDVLLIGRLARARGVVVGTRMALNLAIARFTPDPCVRIVQEHLQLERYAPRTVLAVERYFSRVDLVVPLTTYDAEAYRRHLPDGVPPVKVIPNAIPDELPERADPSARRIVAVGRLSPEKAYDRLIEAFALVANEYPEWDLRIVGSGGLKRSLRKLAVDRGVGDRVTLPGRTEDVDAELAGASIFGVSSIHESLPMAILEAMAAGLTVVSFACQTGPVELIEHGGNGLLAAPDDIPALAEQLRVAMDDADLRRRLGARAREDACAFALSSITDRWLQVFTELAEARGGTNAPR